MHPHSLPRRGNCTRRLPSFERFWLKNTEIVDKNVDIRKLPHRFLGSTRCRQIDRERFQFRADVCRPDLAYRPVNSFLCPAVDG
jgi:hypothetical protein